MRGPWSPIRWAAAAALSLALGLGGLAQAASAVDARPAGVRVEATDEMGPVLADPQGRTLYTWVGDRKAGESKCNAVRYDHAIGSGDVAYYLPEPDSRATCQQIWPPFLAPAGAVASGAWTIIARADGTRQWALNGKPLYTFAHDDMPGAINGLGGASGRLTSGRYPAWAPLESPGGVVAANTAAGRVLMTDKGQVLYVSSGAVIAKASCGGDCLGAWKPLLAPAVAEPPRGWSITTTAGGARQWAFGGKALYTHAGDVRYGDLSGMDEAGWRPVVLQKPLAPPAELSVQMTADGEVYADGRGMTLYSWGCVDEAEDRALCDVPGASQTYRRALCGVPATCIATWRPVVAAAAARPVGRTWSIVTVDPTGAYQYAAPGQTGGLRVWAYRGRPVYTFAGDQEPGDMNGHNIRSFVLWGFGMVRANAGGGRSGG